MVIGQQNVAVGRYIGNFGQRNGSGEQINGCYLGTRLRGGLKFGLQLSHVGLHIATAA